MRTPSIDLHNHTTLSDGKQTTEELVANAIRNSLDIMAITDHDTINRTGTQLLRAANIISPEAAEISARDYDGEHPIHLTFYAESISQEVDDILGNIRMHRVQKVQAQCELLKKHGFNISFNDVRDFAKRARMGIDCVSNNHLAQAVIEKEENCEIAKRITWQMVDKHIFIRAFLKETSPFKHMGYAKISNYEPDIVSCWEMARAHNGVLSIAHPQFSWESFGWMQKLLEDIPRLVQAWINGIEINPFATQKEIEIIRSISEKMNLIITFGSDNHGEFDGRHGWVGTKNPHLKNHFIWSSAAHFTEKVFG